MNHDLLEARQALCDAGKSLAARNWTPATSGNFSLRVDNEFLITRSGADKGQLNVNDILRLNHHGQPMEAAKASAETDLHLQIYQLFPHANCVLHVHSLHATALSMTREQIRLSGYELLKALPGIETHETSIDIPIVQNSQNMADIMREFSALPHRDAVPAYIIRGHGMYCWGNTIRETMQYIEALDFLFQCELLVRA